MDYTFQLDSIHNHTSLRMEIYMSALILNLHQWFICRIFYTNGFEFMDPWFWVVVFSIFFHKNIYIIYHSQDMGLHLKRFDPSHLLVDPVLRWIYAGCRSLLFDNREELQTPYSFV